ncbi:serine/threonine-protein kinase [Baekduia sp.]|uniref:CHASE2 domain-containing serine/threonine-protein kinase n=1 Tax=Baekduia sp. TaxID=2600305 RepID=UPI002D7924C2|nr:serine/threonine-protein kinase [Baekduia sp.]
MPALALPAVVGAVLGLTGAPARLELETVRARFAVRGTEPPPSDVVLVAIDRESLTALGSSWPLPRIEHARAIDRLTADGARAIAYDVELPAEGTTAAARRDSAAVRAAARRAGNVVFAAFAPDARGRTNVLAPAGELSSMRTGFSGFRTENGLPAGTVPIAVGGLASLSATVARAVGVRLPSDLPDGEARIAFAGPPGTVSRVRFSDLLAGHVPSAAIRGKIAVVAATDPGVKDVLATVAPGGDTMAGGEVQANAISTWLRGVPLRSAPWWLDALLIGAMALAVPLAALRLGRRGAFASAVIVPAVFLVATQALFAMGVVTLAIAPLVAFALSAAGALVLGLWRADRAHKELRERFAAGDAGVVGPLLARPVGVTSIVAGYRMEELLARGGMGVVYRAVQLTLDRPVAIKLIAPERTADPVFRSRFALESRIAATIEHPNVIPVYETGDDDGLLFIAMRLVDGVDLARLVNRAGPLSVDVAVDLVTQAAAALDAAHAGGLVHRDVKPGNLLLTAGDPAHVYLTDFGLARHVGPSTGLTQPDAWVGTLDFLAPEQLRGDPVDGRADVYALAGVLHFCLTGRAPFEGENAATTMWGHLNAPPPRAGAVAPGVPEALDDALVAGLAKDPADRPASARAFAGLVVAAAGHLRSAPPPRAPVAAPPPVGGPTIASSDAEV